MNRLFLISALILSVSSLSFGQVSAMPVAADTVLIRYQVPIVVHGTARVFLEGQQVKEASMLHLIANAMAETMEFLHLFGTDSIPIKYDGRSMTLYRERLETGEIVYSIR